VIRFEASPTPDGFAERVAQPGNVWLAAHPTGRPPDHWNKQEFKGALAIAFRNLCAYSAMYEPVGTVDHFVSCDEDRSKAYEWSNYRYASGWINSSKNSLRSQEVLDPFEVGDDWFEVILPSLQLVATDRVPLELVARARSMLERLHLGHDERVLRQRRMWYGLYQEGVLSLDGLARLAPLIARAVNKRRMHGFGEQSRTQE
jgi:hypothetical protein